MRFGSVCSGIEAASVAWHPLGWQAAWLSEIEPFPSSVLKHHYPEVPNHGDMTALPARVMAGEVEAPDVFCGGTPCQAFSVAGLRNSLDDARGNLSLTFCEIANAIDFVRVGRGDQPAIVFWENVPGVLSTKDNAFGCFLAGLAGESLPLLPAGGRWTDAGCVLGPQRAVAWRVLDAQYFGLAQRRRRVFVVASARAGFDPAAVLFEFDGLRRDSAPSREAGERPAGTIAARFGISRNNPEEIAGCWWDGADVAATITTRSDGQRMPDKANAQLLLADTVTAKWAKGADVPPMGRSSGNLLPITNTLRGEGAAATEDGTGHGCATAAVAHVQIMPTMTAGGPSESSHNQVSGQMRDAYMVPTTAMQVRRLTPVECERLQGFPTVSEKVIIEACLDQQNQGVRAALKCLRWQNSAWPADASGLMPHAHTAAQPSSTRQADPEPLAALHVQLLYGHAVQAIRSRGRLIWSASGAAASAKSPPPTLGGNTAAELARLLHEVARTAGHGKAVSPPSISLSFLASSGGTSAAKSGHATAANASDAESGPILGTFTTSDLGQITTCSDSTAATLCCSVLRAIARCIPSETLPATFSIELTVESPYTAIPWRGKPADQCPDGPRYKALGNSWAVPVVRWIGRRIQEAA